MGDGELSNYQVAEFEGRHEHTFEWTVCPDGGDYWRCTECGDDRDAVERAARAEAAYWAARRKRGG